MGYGKSLMHEAEHIARSRGCRFVMLDTLDFQARPFYQQLGYQLVFVQEDYPVCGKRYYLQKLL
jgi:histone acetyltransferase (RNA polymerase elongator complex component)